MLPMFGAACIARVRFLVQTASELGNLELRLSGMWLIVECNQLQQLQLNYKQSTSSISDGVSQFVPGLGHIFAMSAPRSIEFDE